MSACNYAGWFKPRPIAFIKPPANLVLQRQRHSNAPNVELAHDTKPKKQSLTSKITSAPTTRMHARIIIIFPLSPLHRYTGKSCPSYAARRHRRRRTRSAARWHADVPYTDHNQRQRARARAAVAENKIRKNPRTHLHVRPKII